MCFVEFICYQCGHPSASVVRPCPMTTAGHNFPVCPKCPNKQWFAETMCTPCERVIHSRWVLVRECEHRWLHERGACGCEVTFPGLLYTPRVIGGEAAPSVASPGSPHPAAATEETDSSAPVDAAKPSDAQVEAGNAPVRVAASTAASDSDTRIPAIFSEAVTPSGERHIAVRLPGLYAAEWRDDHRAQHEAGQCACKIDHAPFEPEIPHSELTVAERQDVRRWEQEVEKKEDEASAAQTTDKTDDQDGEDTQRIAEIEKLFGKFNLRETPAAESAFSAAPVVVRSEMFVAARASDRQGHAVRRPIQGQNNDININNSQQGHTTTWHQNRSATSYGSPFVASAQQNFGITQPYQPAATPLNQQQQPMPAFLPQPQVPGHVNSPSPPYGPYNPAYPAFATYATYTNTVPQGAYDWQGPSRRSPNMPGVTQGPGPYRTPGLSFATPRTVTVPPASQQQGHHNQALHVRGGQAYTRPGQGQQQHQQPADLHAAQERLPLLGLPIGAGPEGVSHMPSWRNCRLHSTATSSTPGVSNKNGEDEKAKAKAWKEIQTPGFRFVEAHNDDDDDNGEEADKQLLPPPRCHSAAT
ncbi:hypothetical protein VTK26DRAFT_6986 [Humicola hyalothermophila]